MVSPDSVELTALIYRVRLACGVMPGLLLTRPVRVTALVVEFFLDLALLLGRLSGVLGLGIGVTAGLLVHLCRMSGIAQFETRDDRAGSGRPVTRGHLLAVAGRPRRRTVTERLAAQRFSAVRRQPVGQLAALSAQCRWG